MFGLQMNKKLKRKQRKNKSKTEIPRVAVDYVLQLKIC